MSRCASCDRLARFWACTTEDEKGHSHAVHSCGRHLALHVNGLLAVSAYITVERPPRTASTMRPDDAPT